MLALLDLRNDALARIPEEIRSLVVIENRWRRMFPRPLREVAYRAAAVADVLSVRAHRMRLDMGAKRASQQFFSQLTLAVMGAYDTNDYYSYDGLTMNVRTFLDKDHVPHAGRWEYRDRWNSPVESRLLRNKVCANAILRARGLPCTEIVAVVTSTASYMIEGGHFVALAAAEFASRLHEGEFIVKPALGRWGRGITLISGAPPVWASDMIARRSFLDGGVAVVERRLENHHTLRDEARRAASTIRFMTGRARSGVICIFGAAVRYAIRADVIVDNWSFGGAAAPVELQSGEVVPCPRLKDYAEHFDVSSNPPPARIPFWQRAKALVIAAHELFPRMTSIGWDVMITEDGPMLIEGNDDWDVILPQRLTGRSVLDTPYGDILRAHQQVATR